MWRIKQPSTLNDVSYKQTLHYIVAHFVGSSQPTYWRRRKLFRYFHISTSLLSSKLNIKWTKKVSLPKVIIHKKAIFSNLCSQINVSFIHSILAWVESITCIWCKFMQSLQFIIYTEHENFMIAMSEKRATKKETWCGKEHDTDIYWSYRTDWDDTLSSSASTFTSLR